MGWIMIWVKIGRLDFESKAIYVPSLLAKNLPNETTIVFGGRKESATIVDRGVEEQASNRDILLMGKSLIDSLHIQEELPYQLKFENGNIIIGPVIGLLLGRQCIYYNHKNMLEHTHALSCYSKTGGLFYAFTPEGIDYEKKVIYGLYYGLDQVWKYGCFPFPNVIFRRGFLANKLQVDKIRKYVCSNIFNSSRRNKWEMHKLLEKDEKVYPFLPETYEVHESDIVADHLEKYKAVILKPTDLSRGRGIFILQQKSNGNIEVTDCLRKDNKSMLIAQDGLSDFLLDGGFFNQHYIVQNRLDLATVNGCPFDIRVVMHKNIDDKWRCSGIECRIAGVDNMISNIARGGRALSINRTLLLAFGPDTDVKTLKEKVIEVSTNICKCMDKTGELFAEFGLDIAIDKNKHLWFIEANVRPSFKGFKLMDYRNYLYICSRPIIFASHLAGFESDGEAK